MAFINKFSWSKSRDESLKTCEKKYYFNYYGYWNGWDRFADERTKKIYYLKKINSKEIWIGQIIHEQIEKILQELKNGKEISLEKSMLKLKNKLDSGFIQSQLKEYTKFSSKLNKLFEHEYKIQITKKEKEKLFQKAGKCLINFYNSEILKEIKEIKKEDWLLIEDFLTFKFEGETIFLSIDFAIKKEDKIILYDWKTGKERTKDFDLQMMLYSLYAKEKWGIENEKIVARTYNVSLDILSEFKVNNEKLEKAKQYMKKSIRKMKSKLLYPQYNKAREEDFKKIHNNTENNYPCNRCNFKKICKGEWSNIKKHQE